MMTGRARALALAAMIAVVSACSSDPATTNGSTPPPATPSDPGPAPTPPDIMELDLLAPIDPGIYSIDPDADPSTPLLVTYEVPAGWSQWIGAVKFAGEGHVAVSITTVSNLVRHGCRDHSWADPPIGAGVSDLATALADLPPFRVTSRPQDVTFLGYPATHLELSVPNLRVSSDGLFAGCAEGNLKSWVAAIDTEPGDAFYGYTGPGYTEEFWILDVDGTRLMIAAGRSAGSSPEDVEEQRAVLDSIRFEP